VARLLKMLICPRSRKRAISACKQSLGRPLINANLDDGIAVVKTMVAISHSARQGGDWVGVGDVEGDLEHSFLKRSELTHASPLAYHNQKESQRSGHHSRLTNGSDALQSSAAWQEMIDAMRRALNIAIEFDLKLGIEPEVANVVSNANDALRLIMELGSNRIRIVFDPANLYRPPSDPRKDRHIITDALASLGYRIAVAHCKDIANPGIEAARWQPGETQYSHVAAGTGILDYRHYISELKRSVHTSVPLILHGLSEEQIPSSVAFVRRCLSALERSETSVDS